MSFRGRLGRLERLLSREVGLEHPDYEPGLGGIDPAEFEGELYRHNGREQARYAVRMLIEGWDADRVRAELLRGLLVVGGVAGMPLVLVGNMAGDAPPPEADVERVSGLALQIIGRNT
jgi:hypothetical protein